MKHMKLKMMEKNEDVDAKKVKVIIIFAPDRPFVWKDNFVILHAMFFVWEILTKELGTMTLAGKPFCSQLPLGFFTLYHSLQGFSQ